MQTKVIYMRIPPNSVERLNSLAKATHRNKNNLLDLLIQSAVATPGGGLSFEPLISTSSIDDLRDKKVKA